MSDERRDERPRGEISTLTSGKDLKASGTRPDSGTASDPKKPAKVQGKDRDMGSALRSAYQKTVDETVPDEMMDLLSKLA